MLDKVKALLKPNVSPEAKIAGISLFIGKVLEGFNSRIISLEERQLQKGDKGDKGDKGLNGKDGRDGKDGKDGLNGTGKDGKNGKDGKDGKDGVSVTETYIDFDGHLTVKLSNGKEIDAGKIISSDSNQGYVLNKQVARQQIIVSTTEPLNPQVNDLWFNPQG